MTDKGQKEMLSLLDDLHEAISGTTQVKMMCPSCGYIKPIKARNTDRQSAIIVWQCQCGRMNHTKVATQEPRLKKILEENKTKEGVENADST